MFGKLKKVLINVGLWFKYNFISLYQRLKNVSLLEAILFIVMFVVLLFVVIDSIYIINNCTRTTETRKELVTSYYEGKPYTAAETKYLYTCNDGVDRWR